MPNSKKRIGTNEPAESRLLYTYTQTGAMMGISTRQAWGLVKNGAIPCVRIGRSVRITLRAIEDFIAKMEKGGEA